jgi:hypothetical protein
MKKTAMVVAALVLAAGAGLAAKSWQEGMPPTAKPTKEHE